MIYLLSDSPLHHKESKNLVVLLNCTHQTIQFLFEILIHLYRVIQLQNSEIWVTPDPERLDNAIPQKEITKKILNIFFGYRYAFCIFCKLYRDTLYYNFKRRPQRQD